MDAVEGGPASDMRTSGYGDLVPFVSFCETQRSGVKPHRTGGVRYRGWDRVTNSVADLTEQAPPGGG